MPPKPTQPTKFKQAAKALPELTEKAFNEKLEKIAKPKSQ